MLLNDSPAVESLSQSVARHQGIGRCLGLHEALIADADGALAHSRVEAGEVFGGGRGQERQRQRERARVCESEREKEREREGTISVIRSVWQERWLSYLTDSHFDARGVEAEQGSDCIEVLALVEAGVVEEEEEWR